MSSIESSKVFLKFTIKEIPDENKAYSWKSKFWPGEKKLTTWYTIIIIFFWTNETFIETAQKQQEGTYNKRNKKQKTT